MKCHSTTLHEAVKCMQLCTRVRKCGHPCSKKCNNPCGECYEKILNVLLPCGHETKEVECRNIKNLAGVNANILWSERCPGVATFSGYLATRIRTISNVCIHATAYSLADTIAESHVGIVCRIMITVLAVFYADDYLQLVRTATIIHVTTAFYVLPTICPMIHVASIADTLRHVATCVTLARSNVDGVAIINAVTAVCRVRSYVISFLAIIAAKRTLYLVDINALGFVARPVRIPSFAESAVRQIFLSNMSILLCSEDTAKLRLMRTH